MHRLLAAVGGLVYADGDSSYPVQQVPFSDDEVKTIFGPIAKASPKSVLNEETPFNVTGDSTPKTLTAAGRVLENLRVERAGVDTPVVALLEALLDAGTDVNGTTDGSTPIAHAQFPAQKTIPILKVLIAHNIELRPSGHGSPLANPALSKEAFDLLFNELAKVEKDPATLKQLGREVATRHIVSGHKDAAEYVMKKLSIEFSPQDTLDAASSGNQETLAWVLGHGGNLDIGGGGGRDAYLRNLNAASVALQRMVKMDGELVDAFLNKEQPSQAERNALADARDRLRATVDYIVNHETFKIHMENPAQNEIVHSVFGAFTNRQYPGVRNVKLANETLAKIIALNNPSLRPASQ